MKDVGGDPLMMMIRQMRFRSTKRDSCQSRVG